VSPASGLFFFDASYRPVPLTQSFYGVVERNPMKRVQGMNEIAANLVRTTT
jgi:hypothetical protein